MKSFGADACEQAVYWHLDFIWIDRIRFFLCFYILYTEQEYYWQQQERA